MRRMTLSMLGRWPAAGAPSQLDRLRHSAAMRPLEAGALIRPDRASLGAPIFDAGVPLGVVGTLSCEYGRTPRIGQP